MASPLFVYTVNPPHPSSLGPDMASSVMASLITSCNEKGRCFWFYWPSMVRGLFTSLYPHQMLRLLSVCVGGGPCLFNSLSSVVRYKCESRVENVTRKCNYLRNDSIPIARVSVSYLQTWSQEGAPVPIISISNMTSPEHPIFGNSWVAPIIQLIQVNLHIDGTSALVWSPRSYKEELVSLGR